MKKAMIALAFTAIGPGAALAAECKGGDTEYYLDWTSFAQMDVDPSGRPTRAYAFPVDEHAYASPHKSLVTFKYEGLIRRFDFDSPKVFDTKNEIGGRMSIKQTLVSPYEMTETQMFFEKPVSNLTIELHGVDDNMDYGRAYKDRVSFIGRAAGKTLSPKIRFMNTYSYESDPLFAYESRQGLGGDNIYPVNVSGVGGAGYASYEVVFPTSVKDLALRFTSTEGSGQQFVTSRSPAPQAIELGRTTFCM